LKAGSADRFITRDLQGGRLPEVIGKGEPAVLVCHWPGIYFNGNEVGFKIFQEVVKRLEERYDNLIWMKLSEIARYWAAKELTGIAQSGGQVRFEAPFAAEGFTVRMGRAGMKPPTLKWGVDKKVMREVKQLGQLEQGTWCRQKGDLTVCFDLPKGQSILEV